MATLSMVESTNQPGRGRHTDELSEDVAGGRDIIGTGGLGDKSLITHGILGHFVDLGRGDEDDGARTGSAGGTRGSAVRSVPVTGKETDEGKMFIMIIRISLFIDREANNDKRNQKSRF